MNKELKKCSLFLVFIAIMLINISVVKADAPLNYYISNQEAKFEREYWGYWTEGITKSTPIKVKKGDTITVTVMLNNWPEDKRDMQLYKGNSTIRFDAGAFSPVEVSKEEYSDFSISNIKNIIGSTVEVVTETNYDGSIQNRKLGSFSVSYTYLDDDIEPCGDESCNRIENYNESTAIIKPGLNKLYQIKFKVRDDVKDGIYSIFTLSGDENTVNYSEGTIWDEGNVIYYQVGSSTLASEPTSSLNFYMYGIAFLVGAILTITCIIVAIKIKGKKSLPKIESNQR